MLHYFQIANIILTEKLLKYCYKFKHLIKFNIKHLKNGSIYYKIKKYSKFM
jgi:hypothetical protein